MSRDLAHGRVWWCRHRARKKRGDAKKPGKIKLMKQKKLRSSGENPDGEGRGEKDELLC